MDKQTVKGKIKIYLPYFIGAAVVLIGLPAVAFFLTEAVKKLYLLIVSATVSPLYLAVASVIFTKKYGFEIPYHFIVVIPYLLTMAVFPFIGFGNITYLIYYLIITVFFGFVTGMITKK